MQGQGGFRNVFGGESEKRRKAPKADKGIFDMDRYCSQGYQEI